MLPLELQSRNELPELYGTVALMLKFIEQCKPSTSNRTMLAHFLNYSDHCHHRTRCGLNASKIKTNEMLSKQKILSELTLFNFLKEYDQCQDHNCYIQAGRASKLKSTKTKIKQRVGIRIAKRICKERKLLVNQCQN